MADGFGNRPRILRGAFVEYGLSLPPVMVVFQFNPVQLARQRSLSFDVPDGQQAERGPDALRRLHQRQPDLATLRDVQSVTVAEETISLDVRLDATDDLDDGDPIAETFGVLPRLSTLELMVTPRSETQLPAAVGALVGAATGYSFTSVANPPLVLFIWGRKRVLPVNITRMAITETQYDTALNPIQAVVAVEMTVIEGPSQPAQYTQAITERMSALALAGIADAASIVVPG